MALTKFIAADLRKESSLVSFVKKHTKWTPHGHVHINACLCCKEASTAAGRGSRARPAEVDTIVAALEDRLGSTWAEFQSTPSHFNAVNADDIVRRYDEWRGTEAARIYVLERCEDHGLD